MRIIGSLAVAVLVVAASSPARAQYTNSYGYSFDNPVTSTANQFFWDGLNRRLLLRMMLKKRGYTDAQLGQIRLQQAVSDGDTATAASLKSAAGDALRGFLKLDPASFRITRNGLELIRP
jgi:hypothetical protein